MTADLLVIGAGPAGLAAALGFKRARPEGRVTVIDRMPVAGAKLAVTGGGRGNLSRDLPADGMATAFGKAARFVAPAMRGLPPSALRERLREIGVPTVVEEGGGIYPASQSAASVRDALVAAARRAGVELRLGVEAGKLERDGEWLAGGFTGRRAVLAAGGMSAPGLGSDGSGFGLARRLGHAVTDPVPALAPLHVREGWTGRLAGVSVKDVSVWVDAASALPGAKASGDLLFTHKGLSGPAALSLSGAVARRLAAGMRSVAVRAGFVREAPDFAEWRRKDGAKAVLTMAARLVPRALAAELLALAGVPGDVPCARLSSAQERAVAEALAGLAVTVDGTGGFGESMATAGGVSLAEVAPKTLESRLHPGLHFAGEILDVDGPTGGYNLQWAFASGWLAGSAAARETDEAAGKWLARGAAGV